MDEQAKYITDYYNELIKRVTYYTSIFMASLSFIVVAVILNPERQLPSIIRCIFLLYLLSVLSLVIIGNIIWQNVDSVILSTKLSFNLLESTLKSMDVIKNSHKKFLAELTTLHQNKSIEEINEIHIQHMNEMQRLTDNLTNFQHSKFEQLWKILFNWNIVVSVALLGLGIILIVFNV